MQVFNGGTGVRGPGQNQDEVEGQMEKFLTFRLAEEHYGLEILQVKEIIGILKITRVPRTPGYIRGVINLRGKVLPVMDLRLRFGMGAIEETEETCIIVVDATGAGNVLMGLLVDSVSEVLDIASSDIEDAQDLGENVKTEFIRGVGKAREKVILLLDIQAVLDSEDRDKAAEDD
ncbi:chemotaxis protein CheW [bacterium]|nr:chemotaxis protein CheW [bacterium]